MASRCSCAFLVPVFWVFTICVGCFAILPWGIMELRKTGEETHVQVGVVIGRKKKVRREKEEGRRKRRMKKDCASSFLFSSLSFSMLLIIENNREHAKERCAGETVVEWRQKEKEEGARERKRT